MMQMIRSTAGKFVVIPIILAFLGWMVFEIGMEVTGQGNANAGELGRVNGQAITPQAYETTYQQMYNELRASTGGDVSPEQMRLLREQVWDRLVNDALLRQEMARRGIGVSDAEIRFAARNAPYPRIAGEEIFRTNGQFDLRKYQEFLGGPTADASLLSEIEAYFREAIPQSKLVRQLSAGMHVTDAELWRAWQDRFETATVEYVTLDVSKLATAAVQVSDDEIRRYYREHEEEFEREEQARFTVAYLPKQITQADTAWTFQRVAELRNAIVGGEDFAAVAERESSDGSAQAGGDLGMIRKGQTVAPFEEAVWSLPLNEVSQPVLTQFGYHLIRVEARTDSTANVRHILVPIAQSDDALARLDARADSLEELAAGRTGIERAAGLLNATLRRDVVVSDGLSYIPGVGSGVEALEWAAAEASDGNAGAKPVSDIFDSDQAMYLVRLESYTPKGKQSLAQATQQIRRELELQKKRAAAKAEGQKLVQQARGGQTLQQVAAARGLQVQTTGPFSRVQPNPVFGQANAAIGAAFGVPLNQVSDVVETPGGLFIIRPVQRTAADRKAWEAQKEEQRASTLMQLQQDMLQRWMAGVRRNADIVDNRDRMLRQANS